MELIKGKTESGFEYTLDPEKVDNYELLEAIAAVEVDGQMLQFPKVLSLLLGDQVKALKDHVRGDNGVVKTENLIKEVADIFTNNKTVKK